MWPGPWLFCVECKKKKRKFAKQQKPHLLRLALQLDNPNKNESAVASLTGSHGALIEPNR